MAAVELFDSRSPIDPASAILKNALEGRADVADRESLKPALYSAGDEIGRVWGQVAESGALIEPDDLRRSRRSRLSSRPSRRLSA
jgi:hypothetical protein